VPLDPAYKAGLTGHVPATTNLSKIEFSPWSRRERGERIFCLAERYRQIKGFLFLKTRLMMGTTAIKGIDLSPEGTEFLLQSPPPDWSRRKISLCDLCASAVKPGVERGES